MVHASVPRGPRQFPAKVTRPSVKPRSNQTFANQHLSVNSETELVDSRHKSNQTWRGQPFQFHSTTSSGWGGFNESTGYWFASGG